MGKVNRIKSHSGFTIIELLVVIVVIGILSTFVIVNYIGIAGLARKAAAESDLSNASKQIEIFKSTNDNESYPQTVDCDQPDSETNLCLKSNDGNSFVYKPSTGSNGYSLYIVDSTGAVYRVINGSSPEFVTSHVTVPIVSSPQSRVIANTSATLGAEVTSTGGVELDSKGICWGLLPNPTTNCSASIIGRLARIGTIPTTNTATSIVATSDNIGVFTNDATGYIRDSSIGLLTKTQYEGAPGGPGIMSVSPNGLNIYMSSAFSSVFAYSRNPDANLIGSINMSLTDGGVYSTVVSPDGKFVYSANNTSQSITIMSINQTTGATTAIESLSIGQTPYDICVSVDGKNIYTANSGGNVSILNRDQVTGLLSFVSNISSESTSFGIKVSDDNKNVYVANLGAGSVSVYSRDINNGSLTSIQTITEGTSSPMGVVISADGQSAYVSNNTNSIAVFDRDIDDGRLTYVNSLSTGNGSYRPAITADGRNVYVVNYSSLDVSEYYRENSPNDVGITMRAVDLLPANTTIYYRGYATNFLGTAYSEDGTFTTLP